MSICEAAGLGNHRDAVRAAGLETLRHMVMAGIGIALVPETARLAAFGAGESTVYRRFEPPEPKRQLALSLAPRLPHGLPGIGSGAWTGMKRMIASLIFAGLVSILSNCAEKPIDILCPPAGQCPDVHGFHSPGGG
jgi:LysR substrate binding domain